MSSAQLGRHIYPYSWLQAPKTAAWAHLGWPAANATVEGIVRLHNVEWRGSSCGGVPPRR